MKYKLNIQKTIYTNLLFKKVIYSSKIKDLKDFADVSNVAVLNYDTNEGRALLLLQSNGLIKLKDGIGFIANIDDIVEDSNVKNLKIIEIEQLCCLEV